MERNRGEYRHPSYGLIGFNRVYGNSGILFGTDLQSNDYIELVVTQNATMIHDDVVGRHFFASSKLKNEVVKVKMSNTQFADLITNMNRGDGVPCTIEKVLGERVEQVSEPEAPNIFVNQQKDFKERMVAIAQSLKDNRTKAHKFLRTYYESLQI